jgi:hypothetical protein
MTRVQAQLVIAAHAAGRRRAGCRIVPRDAENEIAMTKEEDRAIPSPTPVSDLRGSDDLE